MTSKGKKKGKELIVVPEVSSQCDVMITAFKKGSKTELVRSSTMIKKSSAKVEAERVGKRSGINRMSVAISNTPSYLTGSSVDKNKTHKNPKNMVSGIGYGGVAFLKGVWDGVTGLVTQPYKGGKEKGAKGVAVGMGKGLIGLVAKPVAGTVGLVGCTVQGTVNTPGTIKRAVTKKKTTDGEDDDEEEKKEDEVNPDNAEDMELEFENNLVA